MQKHYLFFINLKNKHVEVFMKGEITKTKLLDIN